MRAIVEAVADLRVLAIWEKEVDQARREIYRLTPSCEEVCKVWIIIVSVKTCFELIFARIRIIATVYEVVIAWLGNNIRWHVHSLTFVSQPRNCPANLNSIYISDNIARLFAICLLLSETLWLLSLNYV